MKQEVLRNEKGLTIGYLRMQGTVTRLFNAKGKLQGSYDSKTNVTYNVTGGQVARCNVLVSLLKN